MMFCLFDWNVPNISVDRLYSGDIVESTHHLWNRNRKHLKMHAYSDISFAGLCVYKALSSQFGILGWRKKEVCRSWQSRCMFCTVERWLMFFNTHHPIEMQNKAFNVRRKMKTSTNMILKFLFFTHFKLHQFAGVWKVVKIPLQL